MDVVEITKNFNFSRFTKFWQILILRTIFLCFRPLIVPILDTQLNQPIVIAGLQQRLDSAEYCDGLIICWQNSTPIMTTFIHADSGDIFPTTLTNTKENQAAHLELRVGLIDWLDVHITNPERVVFVSDVLGCGGPLKYQSIESFPGLTAHLEMHCLLSDFMSRRRKAEDYLTTWPTRTTELQ